MKIVRLALNRDVNNEPKVVHQLLDKKSMINCTQRPLPKL